MKQKNFTVSVEIPLNLSAMARESIHEIKCLDGKIHSKENIWV
jgi:hypothetical protein